MRPGLCEIRVAVSESQDGTGAADNDQQYVFGNLPTTSWTHPFTAQQFIHLRMLRSRIVDARAGVLSEQPLLDDLERDEWPAE